MKSSNWVALLFLACIALARPASALQVSFDLTPLGGDVYRYDYTLVNDSAQAVRQVDILFDPAFYDEASLTDVSLPTLAADWELAFLGSAPGVPAAFDIFAPGAGLAPGAGVSGFAVQFSWLGVGTPGPQPFEVYDADTFDLVQSGTTTSPVPEPTTWAMLLMGLIIVGMAAKHRRRGNARAVSAYLGAIALMGATLADAAPKIEVVDMRLESQKRISRTVYEYSYRLVVKNLGTAAADVRVKLDSAPPAVTPISRHALLPAIGAGEQAVSDPTIMVRHDRSAPWRFSDLVWSTHAQDGTFTGRLVGATDSLATSVTQNYVIRRPPGPIGLTPDNSDVDLSSLEIEFSENATIGQINAVLDSIGGRIVSMSKGTTRLVISFPAASDYAALKALAAAISGMPGIEGVSQNIAPSPLVLPSNPPFADPHDPSFYDYTSTATPYNWYIDHHLAIRAHALWNLRGMLDKPELKKKRPIMVYQDYFGLGSPQYIQDPFDENLWTLRSPPLWSLDDSINEYSLRGFSDPPTDIRKIQHGYKVMSIVSSNFGGSAAANELTTGIYPAPLETWVSDLFDFSAEDVPAKTIDIIATFTTEALTAEARRNVILNTSTGLCANNPCTPEMREEAARLAGSWIKAVRARLLDPDGNPEFLHVYAAGNNRTNWAYHDSWGAADALLLKNTDTDTSGNPADPFLNYLYPTPDRHSLMELLSDTSGTYVPRRDPSGSPITLPLLDNMLGVESRYNTPSVIASFPGNAADGIPPEKRLVAPYPNCNVFRSATHGSISAIGGTIAGFRDPETGAIVTGNPLAVWVLDWPFGNASNIEGGTSMAAPQVAGVAAWVWSLRPDLTMREVRNLILVTASPPYTACADASSYSDPVDAYAAALATDNPYSTDDPRAIDLGNTTDAPVRRWLLDVASVDAAGNLSDTPDGKFTQADILKFLQEFEHRRHDKRPDYSRYDLNGNGVTGDATTRQDLYYSRFDLDGNHDWSTAAKTMEGLAGNFREDITTDLEVLFYYAYSPLYEGNEYERTLMLLPYVHKLGKTLTRFLSKFALTVPPSNPRSTTFRIESIATLPGAFTSFCGGVGRGAPLYQDEVEVFRAARYPDSQTVYWQSYNQSGRLEDQPFNASSCSSFIASIPASGRVWINSASRHVDTATGTDVEYQTRIYLGDPDLMAGPTGDFTAPPKRQATQSLSYGIVASPTAAFSEVFNTRDFSLGRPAYVPPSN